MTDHADDSVLSDGVLALLTSLSRDGQTHGVSVAILSGRSLDGLAQFDFPSTLTVLGSYGGEHRDRPTLALDDVESARFDALDDAAQIALVTAGDGAWIERKPASLVLHVRQAEASAGSAGLRQLAELQKAIPGSDAHAGNDVLEVLARPNDKGSALERLRSEEEPGSMVYLGDDVPDEDAFAVLGDRDLSIKVGPGATRAGRRLDGPDAVTELLRALVAGVSG